MLNALYKSSLALLTDLYELTMAYGYWKCGLHEREAVFHLFFREPPFGGGYTIACGLGTVGEYLDTFRFDRDDIRCLAALQGNDGKAVFEPEFLSYLATMKFSCDLDAVPEGTVVFPHEPLVRVRGPLIQAQILETALLNIINFQTLIATKAARICHAARGEPVLEFGLRRAQGIDGSLSASRAAYIGGCVGTSNVLANRLMGIPVKGTHAHSWVMCFDSEPEAFRAYAEAMPNNCVFLVDTYDTLQGVRNAARVGCWLKEHGHRMLGIRLDSGDLASLSIEARNILDEAGLQDAFIVASNDLDETAIASLKEQGATIGVWGVGTRLVSAYDQPALGGVYKLSALRDVAGAWQYKIKLSEELAKASTPGILQVRRYVRNGEAVADAMYDIDTPLPEPMRIVSPVDMRKQETIPADATGTDLLVPIYRDGKRIADRPTLDDIRHHRHAQLALFHSDIRHVTHPHSYPAGLSLPLHEGKMELIEKSRNRSRVSAQDLL